MSWILLPVGFKYGIPWSEVGSTNHSATWGASWLKKIICNYNCYCQCTGLSMLFEYHPWPIFAWRSLCYHHNLLLHTVNVLKFRTPNSLTKCHMQTVQTQIRRSSLIRVYAVCHSSKYFKKPLHKKQNLSQKKKKSGSESARYSKHFIRVLHGVHVQMVGKEDIKTNKYKRSMQKPRSICNFEFHGWVLRNRTVKLA